MCSQFDSHPIGSTVRGMRGGVDKPNGFSDGLAAAEIDHPRWLQKQKAKKVVSNNNLIIYFIIHYNSNNDQNALKV